MKARTQPELAQVVCVVSVINVPQGMHVMRKAKGRHTRLGREGVGVNILLQAMRAPERRRLGGAFAFYVHNKFQEYMRPCQGRDDPARWARRYYLGGWGVTVAYNSALL